MDEARSLVAVVLAAGEGTRMRSDLVKVLHPVLGRPMAAFPVAAALGAGATRVAVVVGHQAPEVRAALERAFPDADLQFPVQERRDGTGGALRAARHAVEGADLALVLCGDTPALDAATLAAFLDDHRGAGRALTVLSFVAEDPTGYGRIVRDAGGRVRRIVEHRDATEDERRIGEVNAGVYAGAARTLLEALAKVGSQNAQGEVYLTDVVERVASEGGLVGTFTLREPLRVAGVNTRAQLAEIEGFMLAERRRILMESGVTMVLPETIVLDHDVAVGRDTVLGPGVQLRDGTVVGERCRIDAGCVLTGTRLGDGVHVKPYVVAEEAVLEDGAEAGPFAHLRPGTVLGPSAKVGNFVETKKARIGRGSKANHLSYLGDCEVGEEVNVGAGTITCNYDGVDKHRTVIEDGVFIGSDTQLVAPVRVGRRATVAAGTTVTADVPAGALVLSRAPQVVKEGYDERRRRPREEAKRRAKGEG